MKHFLLFVYFLTPFFTLSSCAVLIGNVKPTEKSDRYEILRLDRHLPDWKKLSPPPASTAPNEEEEEIDPDLEISDRAFQSKKTGSVISINTACRLINQNSNITLNELSALLFSSVKNITNKKEEFIEFASTPALLTTLNGQIDNKSVKIKTIVFKKDICIYDLMYIARPENFQNDLKNFQEFMDSFKFN